MPRVPLLIFPCALGALLLCTSCLDLESLHADLIVDENLAGSATLSFFGITSDKSTPEARAEEMLDFHNTLNEHTSEQASIWALHDETVTVNNRTDTRCDVEIHGRMRSLIQTLAVFTDKGDFSITRVGQIVSVQLPPADLGDSDDEFTVRIQLPCPAKSHNASSTDMDGKRLTWTASSMGQDGIEFSFTAEE